MEYLIRIHRIVERVGVENMSFIWKLFKLKKTEEAERDLKEIEDRLRTSLQNHLPKSNLKQNRSINSYYVALEDINTAEYLCENFDT